MKEIFLFFLLAATLPVLAQNKGVPTLKEGIVVYERVTKLEGVFRGPDGEVADKMPKQLTERFELLFSGKQSLWQSLPDVAEEAAAASGDVGNTTMLAVRLGGGAEVVYQDRETNMRLMQSELRAKTYLVEDSLATPDWKVSDESKIILGYQTKKASAVRYGMRTIMGMENGVLKPQEQRDTSTIVAWFAPDIPAPAGPEYSGGLPGLVLELDENGGRSIYKAISVSSKPTGGKLKAPKSGRRITAAAFRNEQKAFFAEMQQRMQQGGRVSVPFGN